ncbi:MAG: hypothetical protein AAGJ38_06975 [Planctomycetota bacterium]
MRRLVDIFVVVAVLAVVVFVVQSRPSAEDRAATIADVQHDMERLYERASYYGALENSIDNTNTVWPVAVMPAWFGEDLPTNALLIRFDEQPRPWIDVAPPGDRSPHPPDPVAVRPEQAQFWYNPNVGLFRARVAPHLGETEATALYNQLNGVELAVLDRDTDPARIPLAYTPGTTPSSTLASREPATMAEVAPARPAPSQPTLFLSDPAPTLAPAEPVVTPRVDEEPPAPRRGRSRMKDQSP